jgi:hypothetical protein
MSRIEKTVFVSYRRTNAPWALAIYQYLNHHGYDAFIDFQGIASGGFEQVILENIRARAHFLVLLTPSALEHCGDPKDWLRRKIETALESRRNVVPVLLDGFDFEAPLNASRLRGQLSALKDYNALRVYAEYFAAAMDMVREYYLNVPLDAVLHPASRSARQAALQLKYLTAPIEEEQRMTATTTNITDAASATTQLGPGAFAANEPEYASPLRYGQEPSTKAEYFVSYAWKDDTPEGKAHELIVDQLCSSAEQRGITILRDKKVLGLGDRISAFMQRIGRGNLVFVVLSNKYLKSPFCMYELYEIWRNCRQDDAEFLSHVRVYTLPSTEIWTPFERAKCAAYWRDETNKLEAMFKDYGFDILGKTDVLKYLQTKKFSREVSEILAIVTDILQPQDFEQLKRYGFSDCSS